MRDQRDQYLYTSSYDNDVTELIALAHTSKHQNSQNKDEQYKRQLQDSYLVPEDNTNLINNTNVSQTEANSFTQKLQKNPSLMLQLDTIFKPFLQQGPYKECTKLFLSWITMAQKHLKSQFLKPLYKIMADQMIKFLNAFQVRDPQLLLKKLDIQIRSFVNVMSTAYKEVYKMSQIEKTLKGKLFKDENINHFVLCNLFKTKDFMNILRSALLQRQRQYIQGFQMRLRLMEGNSLESFNIPPQFQLFSRRSLLTESGSIANVNSYQSAIILLKKITSSNTPISKLKILLQVQKEIVKEIYNYYSQQAHQIPQIQPDVITSLTMFVVVKSRLKQLPIDLKIIQMFSSKNALNSISGFYVSTFSVVISMIDAFQQ